MLIRFILGEEANGRFPALVRIEGPGTQARERKGSLPAIPPGLNEVFRQWREAYIESGRQSTSQFRDPSLLSNPEEEQLDPEEERVKTNTRINAGKTTYGRSIVDSDRDLRRALNDWLNSGDKEWLKVRDFLVDGADIPVSDNETIRVFLEFDDPQLRRLPWRAWDVFEKPRFKKSGITFAALNGNSQLQANCQGSVRIIVVVGNNKDIE